MTNLCFDEEVGDGGGAGGEEGPGEVEVVDHLHGAILLAALRTTAFNLEIRGGSATATQKIPSITRQRGRGRGRG